jgi:hypothetical protein
MRKLPPFLKPAFLKLAQNYIPAMKIFAQSSSFGCGKDAGKTCWLTAKGAGWSRALGPAAEAAQMTWGFSP